MKIVTIVGARPQFVKAATVSRVIRAHPGVREVLLHTGQHYDDNMSDIFFRELEIPAADVNLGIGSGSHGVQTGAMLAGIESVLIREKPDMTLVYGDTNSTLAGALASVKLHIPVAHVEAGLRSFNRAMPEEINRIATDHVSELLFAPTPTAMENLDREGLGTKSIRSGDVMYDSVLWYHRRLEENPGHYRTEGIPGEYLLATIHRAENTDHPENLDNILKAFSGAGLPIVWPVHPRTAAILKSRNNLPPNLLVIPPVGYLQMLRLTLEARKVLTDSGGLQKEAYFLQRPCITLRTETEWTETLHDGWNLVTGTHPDAILQAVAAPAPGAPVRGEFGQGNAASVILDSLLRF